MARVVVALDGSSVAEQAIPQAVARLRAGDQLLLLRIVEPDGPTAQAQSYLEQQAAPVLRAGIQVETLVRAGAAAEEILRVLAERHADLLVLAPHGGGGWKRRLLGSVAQHVVRQARCPVWLARWEAAEPAQPRVCSTVMIALDTSRLAEKGLEFAHAWLTPPARTILLGATDRVPAGQQLVTQDLGDYLDAQVLHLRESHWNCEALIEDGPAAECILRAAAREQVDLLIMATHGRTGLARLAMGSVAEQVLDEASCPIALINARATTAPEPTETEALLGPQY